MNGAKWVQIEESFTEKYGWDKVSLINQNDEEIYSDELIKFEVDIHGEITLRVNRGSEFFSRFANEFADRFGE